MITLNYHENEIAKALKLQHEVDVFSDEIEVTFTIEEITNDDEITTETGYVSVIDKIEHTYTIFDFSIKSTADKIITELFVTPSDGGEI